MCYRLVAWHYSCTAISSLTFGRGYFADDAMSPAANTSGLDVDCRYSLIERNPDSSLDQHEKGTKPGREAAKC